MRVAILFAPDDHCVAERARVALGDTQAFLTPFTSNVVFGPRLVLLAVWTRHAVAHAEMLDRLVATRGGVVIWRADGAETPAALEPFSVCADASPRDLASALKLAEKQIVQAPDDAPAPHRSPVRRVAATVAGAGVALALGAAGAAAFMLDGQDALAMVQGRAAAEATR